ncbi:hypothetical protein ACWGCW_38115 [Streptomyces sp. NPDC054933]
MPRHRPANPAAADDASWPTIAVRYHHLAVEILGTLAEHGAAM